MVARGAEAHRINPVDVVDLAKKLEKKSSEYESMYSSGRPINSTKYGDFVVLRRKGVHPQAGVGSVFDDFDYLPSVDSTSSVSPFFLLHKFASSCIMKFTTV